MEKTEENILTNVGNIVADDPIRLEVAVEPKHKLHHQFQKWGWVPKSKVFHIKPIRLGSLVRISRLLLEIDSELFDDTKILETNYKAINEHHRTLAKIIAIAIHNKKSPPPKRLVNFIIDQFTAKSMLSVLIVVLQQMDLTSFMSSIISMKGLNVMAKKTVDVKAAETKEMSPKDQGS